MIAISSANQVADSQCPHLLAAHVLFCLLIARMCETSDNQLACMFLKVNTVQQALHHGQVCRLHTSLMTAVS